MIRPAAALVATLVVSLSGCKGDERSTPPPAGASVQEVALSGAAVMIGTGDIAVCGKDGDEATAALVDSVLKVDSAANVETAVFTIGDNVYPGGSASDFAKCFTSSWGDPQKSIMKVVRPAPGNHDYRTPGAAAYYKYFGDRAGPRGRGYYSYEVGEWHVVSLNSEIAASPRTPNAARAQEEWLRKDLADNPSACTLAYFHRPLFSSGDHGADRAMRPLWDIMFEMGVDVVLSGHEHNYERFLPQTPAGVADSVRGIEQIVVGTGGGGLRGIRKKLAPNSAVTIHGYFGVLKLNLGAGEYRRAFIDTTGRIWDSGGRRCS